jgi:lipopolysaccharide biosynthesis glycosyltransferase
MDIIHLCIAADNNYKLPLTTLVNSICKNSTSHKCVVHILFTGLSKTYRDKLAKKYSKISFDFIDMSKYDFDFHGLDMQHWTKAIFYRIMIPEIFKDLKRILYIDGDTLVLQDLYEFFNMQLPDDKMMAMVVDRFSYKNRIPVLKTSNYFNSGMILFDIKKCRDFGFSDKCTQWIFDNPDTAKFPDQDAINVVCDSKIERVNNLYNKQFATNDRIKLDNMPFIVHFLSAIKPWMKTAPVVYSRIYRKFIPSIFDKIFVLIKQIIFSSRHFLYHEKYAMTLKRTKITEQIKYYVCNVKVWTRTISKNKSDLITILKNNRDHLKCS